MPQQILFNTGSIVFTTSSLQARTFFSSSSTSTHPSLSSGFTASAGLSRKTFLTTSQISVSVASASKYGIATGSYTITIPITESNGSASIFQVPTGPDSQSYGFTYTSSVSLGLTGSGNFAIHKPKVSGQGSQKTFMFVSSSGNRIGFNTATPTDEFDIKVDTFKIRSADGKKEAEFADGRFITKKFNNVAAGGEATAETSGSEISLTYTPGTFENPSTASLGDVLGTITWEDLSIGNRDDATAMRIQGVVNAVASDGTAIKGGMNFAIGSSTAGEPINETMQLSEGGLTLSSSRVGYDAGLLVNGNVTVGHTANDDDRKISFQNDNTSKRWVIGVDDNQSVFAIHQGASFTTHNDFEISSTGNVEMQNDLTVKGDITVQGNIVAQEFHTELVSASVIYESGSTKFGNSSDDLHEFTGSFELVGTMSKGTVNGGTF